MGKAKPFETRVPFLSYIRLPQEQWLTKLAPEVHGDQNLREFLKLALPSCQEVHPEASRLFNRLASEGCGPQCCFGEVVPMFIETFSWSFKIQINQEQRYELLTKLHFSWRDYKGLALLFLEMVEGPNSNNGYFDCLQCNDHCCSNQVRSEIVALPERCLNLNEGVQATFHGLGYLTAPQQSLAECVMSAWEANLSHCRYLLTGARRRRIIIDAKRGCGITFLGHQAVWLGRKRLAGKDLGNSPRRVPLIKLPFSLS